MGLDNLINRCYGPYVMDIQHVQDDDDAVWRALANPVRRSILDLLHNGPLLTGEIEQSLGGGRHVVVQHLKVLRDAGLVIVEPRGRQRLNYLNPVPIQQIYQRWVSQYSQPWVSALTSFKHAVESTPNVEDERKAVG